MSPKKTTGGFIYLLQNKKHDWLRPQMGCLRLIETCISGGGLPGIFVRLKPETSRHVVPFDRRATALACDAMRPEKVKGYEKNLGVEK